MVEEKKRRIKYELDPRIAHTERNVARWTGAFGGRAVVPKDGKVERVLVRKSRDGNVVAALRLAAVGYNGKFWLLGARHKKMWNLLERLFRRQGQPATNWIEISSINFYDFLYDIASMDDPNRRKNRDSKKHSDDVYELLMVICLAPWLFEDFEMTGNDIKRGAYRMNLIDAFEMYGRSDKEKGPHVGKFGMIRIKLNAQIADSLRHNHTTPILIEVQNSLKRDDSVILYGYLSQVLHKAPVFDEEVLELCDRLQIGSATHEIRDMRVAAKEIEGKDFVGGRIIECRVERRGKKMVLFAKRLLSEKRIEIRNDAAEKRRATAEKQRAEDQRQKDMLIREDEYVKRFDALPADIKAEYEKRVDVIALKKSNGVRLGFNRHRNNAIIEVMEEHLNTGYNRMAYDHCNGKESHERKLLTVRDHTPAAFYGTAEQHRLHDAGLPPPPPPPDPSAPSSDAPLAELPLVDVPPQEPPSAEMPSAERPSADTPTEAPPPMAEPFPTEIGTNNLLPDPIPEGKEPDYDLPNTPPIA